MLWISKGKPKLVFLIIYFLLGNIPGIIIIGGALISFIQGGFDLFYENFINIGKTSITIYIRFQILFICFIISNVFYFLWLKYNFLALIIVSLSLLLCAYLMLII